MKPRTYLTAAVAIVAIGTFPHLAGAQAITPEGRKSDEIIGKIHKLDMINQLLPVIMTTDQIKAILPTIEAARAAEKKQMSLEAAELRKVEGLADSAIKEAMEKRKVVPQETMKKFSGVTNGLLILRNAMATDQVDKVAKKVEETLDAGQKKAAANSINLATYYPGKKQDDVPESSRLRTWVKYVLMDYDSYDLLITLSRRSD